ncbi:S-adenosylmethionine:tRNA ribosyltransferase-isomerase [Paludibacter sp. 221]|nr:S-adenosylmethionine:tRNA ribosyltransferase-isomerase [Paludibacter sp. 221]
MSNPNENQTIYINDFDYPLPDNRIAKFPLTKRDSSKLLVYEDGKIEESIFSNLVDFLPQNALLVYNNTRVIQARLVFRKDTGARIEVFCLEPSEPSDYALSLGSTQSCVWKCMVGNLKKWKSGALVKTIEDKGKILCELKAELINSEGNAHSVRFSWDNPNIHFAEILENAGELPIPPYLHRDTEESDKTTYQTVYSKIEGSVAAPTAGLHFTPEVFESLKKKNIRTEELTLHVGAGTFQPVKSETVNEHQMHAEVIEVNKETIENLIKNNGNIIAVGTTSVRTLESLYYIGVNILENPNALNFNVSQWQPYDKSSNIQTIEALQAIVSYLDREGLNSIHASTQIMIKPGYKFRIVNGIITNFHQPKSTLLLLVSAFVKGRWKEIYDYALAHNFRFLSYGDSSLLL